ncbi:MAG: HDOD domain-containing protein [Myxococcota bacterium]
MTAMHARSYAAGGLADNVLEELWFGDDDPLRDVRTASESMAAATAKATGLKPFPAVAQHVLGLLSNPKVDIAALNESLEKDPVLASQLLRLANSALFRPAVPYASLEAAIVRLGTQTVQELVASVAMMSLFEDTHSPAESMRDHGAAVAAIGRILAQSVRYRGVGTVFLAGLMHDVGKLMIHQVGEFDYNTLGKDLGEADRTHLIERETLGYDHAVIGGHVLDAWHLPPALCRAVAWHHQPGRALSEGTEDDGMVVSLVRMADHIEYQLRKSREPDPEFLAHLAASSDNATADFSADVLEALWPKITESVDELLSVLVG